MEYLLYEACEKGELSIIKELIPKDLNIRADSDFAIRTAAHNGHLEIVIYLVEKGADFRILDDYAVCVAAVNGHLEVVKYLISKGANIRAKHDFSIRYCTHFEVLKYIMEYLISKGVDVSKLQKFKNERYLRYLSFCDRIKDRAQKKIYYWWIQICYDPETKVGKRMLERSWLEFDRIQKNN